MATTTNSTSQYLPLLRLNGDLKLSEWQRRRRDLERNPEVVLACADGEAFHVHREVLRESPYFRRLLGEDTYPNTNICIHTISARHLKLLLDYLYNEPVRVPDAELTEFAAAARKLEIKFTLLGSN